VNATATKLGRPLPGDRIHLVGIGGAGMAALAELLLAQGYTVSGSDLKGSRVVDRLLGLGIHVAVPHDAGSVDGADHVIVSNAIPATNTEVERAAALGLPVLTRAELLGRVFAAGRGVAVTGTHGKTTTASMLATVLEAVGMQPSFLIGGDLNDVGSGARLGASDIVVAEADEAFGSFLELQPDLAVVTNIDADHLDFYGDQDTIDDAFVRFLAGRRAGGTAVINADDPGLARIAGRFAPPLVTFGWSDADLVVVPADGGWRLRWRGEDLGPFRPGVPGTHNASNAAAAAAAAFTLGAEPGAVLEALRSFGGVVRRFQVRGERAGVRVVDDYAHNPRKVAATLRAAREAYPGWRVVALFQPHLYSRTRLLADGFGSAFDDADVVVVTDIYGAREEPIPGVSGRLISDAIRARSQARTIVTYVPRLEEAAAFVAGLAIPGDVVLTMGAGDVTIAAPLILELLGDRGEESPPA
jgi:UDP-N-acetylmuramate--alanine ligase